jgi:PPOX class probable F420-dependent enzyme
MQIDTSTELGSRVARRLREELIVWLVTVGPDGVPEPSPVWFLRDDRSVLIFSQPRTPKIRNIRHKPAVALHFDGDGRGGDIVVLTGRAEIVGDAPAVPAVPEYVRKYARAIEQIGMTPESMGAAYSTVLRVTPTKLRGH